MDYRQQERQNSYYHRKEYPVSNPTQPEHNYYKNQYDQYHPSISHADHQTQFLPKIIESGYIVGPPIAYTHNPNLPSNFQVFSPNKSNLPSLIETSPHVSRQFSPSTSAISQPKVIFNHQPSYMPSHLIQNESRHIIANQSQPQIGMHGTGQLEMVSKGQYDRCLSECKNWETKYNELYLKYMNQINEESESKFEDKNGLREQNYRLSQRIKQLEGRERHLYEKLEMNLSNLIEKYKESTMKECFLLADRYRLECKQKDR